MKSTERREMRVRRDKTAALLLPHYLALLPETYTKQNVEYAIDTAIGTADLLLARLDETWADGKSPA